MKSSNLDFILAGYVFVALLTSCAKEITPTTTTASCGAANTSCASATGPTPIPTSATANVPVYIGDPSTTGSYSYANEPLVSVTICSPGHTSPSQCQTISNILLDTGSYGLRIFASAIHSNVQLTQQTVSVLGEQMDLAECAEFGSSADWGSVQTGDVILGGQTASSTPIQVIDINYASIPSGCAALCPDTDPCTAGFNGILGVGLFAQDCGANCESTDDSINPGNYFACDSTGCYDALVGNCGSDGICVLGAPTNQQVLNPVASFASGYNNGVALTLPSVSSNGASAITTGHLQLGIGSPSSVSVFLADSSGMTDFNGADFTTIFQGVTYGSSANSSSSNNPSLTFIDSGSNGLFFPSTIHQCNEETGFYCGTSSQDVLLSASMEDYAGDASTLATVLFTPGNTDTLMSSGNTAFSNLCGASQGEFDWGLPFFYGQTVYVGLDGVDGTLNGTPTSGPYWAF